MWISPIPTGRRGPETSANPPNHASLNYCSDSGAGDDQPPWQGQPSMSPPVAPNLPSPAHIQSWSSPGSLTCFGCVCEFRSTNGTMNRYVPVRKAELKFFHRSLSSLLQRGRAERKTKEQEQEQREKTKRKRKSQGQRNREEKGKEGKRRRGDRVRV